MTREKTAELPMYHTPSGTKLKLYQVGWISNSRDYYATLTNIFQIWKTNKDFWDNLNEHCRRHKSEVIKKDLLGEAKDEREKVLDVGDYVGENIRQISQQKCDMEIDT